MPSASSTPVPYQWAASRAKISKDVSLTATSPVYGRSTDWWCGINLASNFAWRGQFHELLGDTIHDIAPLTRQSDIELKPRSSQSDIHSAKLPYASRMVTTVPWFKRRGMEISVAGRLNGMKDFGSILGA